MLASDRLPRNPFPVVLETARRCALKALLREPAASVVARCRRHVAPLTRNSAVLGVLADTEDPPGAGAARASAGGFGGFGGGQGMFRSGVGGLVGWRGTLEWVSLAGPAAFMRGAGAPLFEEAGGWVTGLRGPLLHAAGEASSPTVASFPGAGDDNDGGEDEGANAWGADGSARARAAGTDDRGDLARRLHLRRQPDSSSPLGQGMGSARSASAPHPRHPHRPLHRSHHLDPARLRSLAPGVPALHPDACTAVLESLLSLDLAAHAGETHARSVFAKAVFARILFFQSLDRVVVVAVAIPGGREWGPEELLRDPAQFQREVVPGTRAELLCEDATPVVCTVRFMLAVRDPSAPAAGAWTQEAEGAASRRGSTFSPQHRQQQAGIDPAGGGKGSSNPAQGAQAAAREESAWRCLGTAGPYVSVFACAFRSTRDAQAHLLAHGLRDDDADSKDLFPAAKASLHPGSSATGASSAAGPVARAQAEFAEHQALLFAEEVARANMVAAATAAMLAFPETSAKSAVVLHRLSRSGAGPVSEAVSLLGMCERLAAHAERTGSRKSQDALHFAAARATGILEGTLAAHGHLFSGLGEGLRWRLGALRSAAEEADARALREHLPWVLALSTLVAADVCRDVAAISTFFSQLIVARAPGVIQMRTPPHFLVADRTEAISRMGRVPIHLCKYRNPPHAHIHFLGSTPPIE